MNQEYKYLFIPPLPIRIEKTGNGNFVRNPGTSKCVKCCGGVLQPDRNISRLNPGTIKVGVYKQVNIKPDSINQHQRNTSLTPNNRSQQQKNMKITQKSSSQQKMNTNRNKFIRENDGSKWEVVNGAKVIVLNTEDSYSTYQKKMDTPEHEESLLNESHTEKYMDYRQDEDL